MANTYYDSELTAEEIEEVLEAINGILTPANNGKVLAISNGKFEARSVQWSGEEPVLESLSVTENGDYYPEAGVDGFDEVHVAVPSSSPTIQYLSVTQNGTYTAPSGVDGYSPVVVNVSGGGGNGNTILHETEYQTSGSFSYSKEITIPKTSTYKITVQTYSNGFSLKINGVAQQYTINVDADYMYLYYSELSLTAGDVITMSCTSTGRSAATFVITDMNGGGEERTVKIKVGPTFEQIFKIPVTSEYGTMINGGATQFITPVKDDGTEAKVDLSLPFEICCTFMLTNAPSANTGRNVFGAIGSYWECPAIAAYNGKLAYFFTTSSGTWTHNAITITPSGYSIPLNTWIVAKIIYDGTKYIFSIDDGTVQASQELTGVTTYYNPNYRFCFGSQANSTTYAIAQTGAKIKIAGTYLKQNGVLVWGEE